MRINIDGHIIEYFWDDEAKRSLTAESIRIIKDDLARNHLNGRLTQSGESEDHMCGWRDINVEDTFLWSYMNGWFNQ